MNQKTAQWLRSIKIPPGHINQGQLQNGYLFGLIFDRLNLSKDKKFKNSQDLACIFQNFKNTKDLLYDHFSIAFPANEIIYRSPQLLQKVRQACQEYEQNKKQMKLSEIKKKYSSTNNNQNNATIGQQKLLTLRQNQIKQQSNFNSTLSNQNRTFGSMEPKMPQKILQIEKKLSKYREQQTRHQLLSLQTRKNQLQTINQAIQDHRYFQMSKLRMNQQMRKQFEKKVADVVAKTDQTKQQRIQKQQQFFRFMKSKKDNFLSSLRQQEQTAFTQGLQDFQLNCLRQGVQLEHDPNKSYQSKQENFNSKVMLERIKDNIKKLQSERKQRQKRANSKYVESQEANLKSHEVWQENYLIQRLQKSMVAQQIYIKETSAIKRLEQAAKDEILLKLSKKTVKPLPQATQQQKDEFQSQLRSNRLVFYDKQIQRLEKKDKTLKAIAQQTLQALLYTVIVAEEQQKNMNFTYSQWKDIQKIFINYQVTEDDKRKKQNSQIQMKQPKQQQVFLNYLKEIKQFELQNKSQKTLAQQKQIAQLIDELIEQAYPKKQLPVSEHLPLYMPLRIGISGNRLAGKTTQIKKIISKYPSLILIDPKKILTQAVQLARPPVQNEDPKKKKDSKKPEQQTPQRIQLKRFGQQILAYIKAESGQQAEPTFDYDQLKIKYVISAIKWKLQQSFKGISPQQQLAKYNHNQQQQTQRIKDFEKNQQQKNKKKDSKKGPVTEVILQSPTFNQFFYTEGFILDNVQLTQQNLRSIEKQLNGFVKIEERLNQQAENLRQQLGQILPIHKSQIPTQLNKGFFNIIINLDVPLQTQQQRNQGRKLDPQTGQIYHPKYNPHPTDIKGLAQRLVQIKKIELQKPEQFLQSKIKKENYYKVFGYQNKKIQAFHDLSSLPLQQINSSIIKIVEQSLRVQYEIVKSFQSSQELKQKQSNQEEKQQNKVQQQQVIQQAQTSLIKYLTSQSSQFLLKKQFILKQSYADSIIEQFSSLPNIRYSFEQSLLQHQRQFIEIIIRPDDKANRILTFQDNYNKLLQEKSSIINDRSAISHLIAKLDELYDSLWISIQAKKNQAIDKRKTLISSSWINSQVQKIVQIGKFVLQAELDYLVDMLAFLIVVQLQSEGKSNDPVIDHLCLGVPKQNQPIESVISSNSVQKVSPRLQFYIHQVQSCLQSLPEWYLKKQIQSKTKLSPQLQNLADLYVQKQKQKINTIVEYLKEFIYSYSEEEMCYFRALVNKMDDWIISGIKDQNEFTYAIYKDLKVSIQRINKSQLKDLFPNPITASIKPIERMTHFHQPIPYKNNYTSQFNYSSFKIFVQELKCLSFSTNSAQSSQILKINFSRFKEYFNKRKKSKLLEDIYLKLDFDTMQQYLITDNEANFREVALGMLLWHLNVLDEQILNNYSLKLSGGSQQRLTLESPLDLQIQCLLPKEIKLGHKQKSSIEHLLFDIMQNEYTHKVQIKEYIDLLGSFNSLQLYKYGDSLMMLNEQNNK